MAAETVATVNDAHTGTHDTVCEGVTNRTELLTSASEFAGASIKHIAELNRSKIINEVYPGLMSYGRSLLEEFNYGSAIVRPWAAGVTQAYWQERLVAAQTEIIGYLEQDCSERRLVQVHRRGIRVAGVALTQVSRGIAEAYKIP